MEMKYLLLMCFIGFVSCNDESICKVVSTQRYYERRCGNNGCYDVYIGPFKNVTCRNLDQMHSTPSLCSEKCTIIFSGKNEILRTNSFSMVLNLEQVFLNSTQIKEIQSRSFSGSPLIKLINLAENQIEKIPENTFSHLSNLKYLDLSDNKIEEIEEESFYGCNSLEYLDFSGNNLRNISSRPFESVLKLKTLNLSRNSLEVLDPNWCFHFHSLKTLIVDHNRISTLVNCTTNFNIDILSISHNLLEVLNGSYFPTTLKQLDLSGNHISKIDNKPFQHLSALRILDISSNQLDNLPFELFVDLENLTHLDVSSNNLKNLDEGVFHGLVSLKFLNLSNIQTPNLETRVFYSTKSLTNIDMSKNALIELNIESLLNFCKHLRFLWLDGNSFTCPDLANVLFRAEEKRVSIPYGPTYGRRNLNGIECFEETPNFSNATKSNQFIDFFEKGFKKSSFFKFFSSFKQPTENNYQKLLEVEKDLLKNISEAMEISERQVIKDLSFEDRKKMDDTNKLVQKLIERIESEKGSQKNSNFTSELLTVLSHQNTAALTAENADIQELTSSLNSLKLMFFVCLLMVVSFGVVKFFKTYNFKVSSNGYSRGNQEMQTIS